MRDKNTEIKPKATEGKDTVIKESLLKLDPNCFDLDFSKGAFNVLYHTRNYIMDLDLNNNKNLS